ncbi:MAG: hypothetical protein WCI89_01820 [bacterium]
MFLHDRAGQVKEYLHGWLLEELVFAFFGLVLLVPVAWAFDKGAVISACMALIAMSPIWLPVYLFNFFWLSWMHYIRYIFWFSQENVLLEVQLPPEVEKSPKAMEMVLNAIHNAGGEATFIARIWRGTYRPIWSFEIACNEGRLGFYIRTPKGWRNILEARMYGQFPEAKFIEVEDYAAKVPFNLNEYSIFAAEYKKKKDIAHALPIKTYIDFGLDKDPDEELKIDPITNVLELLAQIGKNEYFWLQFVVKARKKEEWYGFYLSGNKFIDDGKKEIAAMMAGAADRAKKLTADPVLQAQAAARGMTLLTQAEKERMENIERSMSKQVFECGIRVAYLAKKDNFVGVNAGAVVRFFDTFNGETQNNGLGASRGSPGYDFPWQDWNQMRQNIERRNMFFRYKHRAFFYVPYEQQPEFLTTEELATLWHFPSSSVKTPGLNRVSSRRAEAPANLPTLSE